MHRTLLLAGIVMAGIALAACGTQAESTPEQPSRTVPVQGTNLSRVVLTSQAARRIDLQTAPVRQLPAAGTSAVPLAAVLYLSDGTTWVYTVSAPLTYVRQQVTVAGVDGGDAVLRTGPPAGTNVVTVGAAELLGSEYGVAGGQ